MKKLLNRGMLVVLLIFTLGLCGCEKNTTVKQIDAVNGLGDSLAHVLKDFGFSYEETDDAYALTMTGCKLSVKKNDFEENKDMLLGSQTPDQFLMTAASVMLTAKEEVEGEEGNTDNSEVTLLSSMKTADDWDFEVVGAVIGNSKNRTLQEGFALYVMDNMELNNAMNLAKDYDELSANYGVNASLTLSHIGVYEDVCYYSLMPGTKWKYRIMAASFSKYLIEQYGMDAFLTLYRSEVDNYVNVTSKDLSTLKDDWIASISSKTGSMDEEALAGMRSDFYTSVNLNNPYDIGEIKVACVGDSITWGTELTDRDYSNYPYVLDSFLGTGYTVGNFGNPGSCLMNNTDEPYRYSPECSAGKEFNGDIVVMMLGTNDTKPYNWHGIEEFGRQYEEAIKEYESLSANPTIYLCTPCAALAPTYEISPEHCEEIAEFVRSYGKEHGYTVIDMHAMTKDNWDIYVWDAIHPNNTGARMMAEKVALALAYGQDE